MFGLAVAGAASYAAAIIGSAVVIGWVTDTAILPVLDGDTEASSRVVPVILAVLGVATWKAVSIVVRRTAAGYCIFSSQKDLREELVEHQLRLELAWFGTQSTGDLLAVADNDARQATQALSPLPFATGVSLLIVGTVVLLTVLDPWIGLVALVGMTLVVFVEVQATTRLYPLWEAIQTQTGVVSGVAHESFDGALTIKSLGREAGETQRFQVESDELSDRFVAIGTRWETFRVVIVGLIPTTSLVLLGVGALRIDAGALTAGDLVTALYLLSLLSFPVQLIAFVLFDLAGSIPAWDRVEKVLEADQIVEYGELEASPGAGAAPIDSEVLSFGYDEELVLTDIAIDIPAGKTVAIVGPTASGKSTLTLLLARLWDPLTGTIHLDDRDLRRFARFELPREVAYVPQDAFLFDDTVLGNITMGHDVLETHAVTAAEMAGAHEFIEELPQGYRTPIGERGATLSGGQRQRVALARALVRRPRLLILDDATSAVDPSVESQILRRLRSAELPSTILVVAYRPSSIRLADEVIYLEGGRVVAQGDHATLLAAHPGYARLVKAYEDDAAARARERS